MGTNYSHISIFEPPCAIDLIEIVHELRVGTPVFYFNGEAGIIRVVDGNVIIVEFWDGKTSRYLGQYFLNYFTIAKEAHSWA